MKRMTRWLGCLVMVGGIVLDSTVWSAYPEEFFDRVEALKPAN